MVEKKVAAGIATAVIIASALIFGIILLGNVGGGAFGTAQSNICYFDPYTVQNSGTVQSITVTLATLSSSPTTPISGTLDVGLYSGSNMITSGSESVTVTGTTVGSVNGQPVTPGQNITIQTTTQPQVTAGSQYYLAMWFSTEVTYEATSSGISTTYQIYCSGGLPGTWSTSNSAGPRLPGHLSIWASGTGLTTTTTTTTSASQTTAALSVSISASPSSGYVPLSTTFASSVTGGAAPYTYSWSFGDSQTSTSANPSHTYQGAGTYLAQLKVTDSTGATASASYTIVANSQTTSTTTYTTTTITTSSTSTGTTTITSGSSTFISTYTTVFTSQECLILSNVPQCHLPNTPPGLPIAWATSNMSIQAQTVTGQIFLSPGLPVSSIAASNTISNVAYNSNIMQVEFAQSGPVSLSMQVPQKPASVWADSTQISTWSYANGILTINADPSAITIMFGSTSSSGIMGFLEANYLLIIIVAAVIAAIIGASLRSRS